MLKFKRIASIFLAMVMVVTAMCALSVSASAKGVFDGAVKMEQLEYYSKKFSKANQSIIYKIVLKQEGTLIFRCRESSYTKFGLYNSNAEEIRSGWGVSDGLTVKIEKAGTYYYEVGARYDNSSFTDLYYTFTPTEEPTIKLAVTLKKGNTLNLGAITENYDGKVSFVSTKKSVATVSKGVVTAVAKGQATIRASLDNGTYSEIKIIVK